MNDLKVLKSLSCKATKESMLPIDKLEKLVGEPDSGIEKERKVVHVALHPKFVNNISLGLVNHFNKLINQWHPQLNGLLAGYGRLQLKRPTGNMINEEAHLHLDVQSDFWIFRPTVGRQLKGVVVKQTPTHVSCLVHGVFNVPCHLPQSLDDQEWWGTKAKKGQIVHLTVLKTDMSQRVPFILGDLQNSGLDQHGSQNNSKIVFDDETIPSPPVEEVSEDDWSALVSNNDEFNSKSSKRKKRTLVDSDDNLSSDEIDVQRKSLIDPVLNS
jgi:hypothetical protein